MHVFEGITDCHDKWIERFASEPHACSECGFEISLGQRYRLYCRLDSDQEILLLARVCMECDADWGAVRDLQLGHFGVSQRIHGKLRLSVNRLVEAAGLLLQDDPIAKRWLLPIRLNVWNQLAALRDGRLGH